MLGKTSLMIVIAGAFATGIAGAASAESFTTRIEPRPFYGAVVTLEEGVRVIRPLPPERQVIINPNKTPLTLGFNDTRVFEQSEVYNYNVDRSYSGAGGPAIYSAPFFGRGLGRHRNLFHHRPFFHRGPTGH